MLNICMLVGEHYEYATYNRTRNGVCHKLVRKHKVYELRCDSCGDIFMRTSKEMHKTSGGHCCSSCNYHRFAQAQSALVRTYNSLDASSSVKI